MTPSGLRSTRLEVDCSAGPLTPRFGAPQRNDGTFQVIAGAPIFAAYEDLNVGTGQSELVVEEAYMAPRPIELFRADFDMDDDLARVLVLCDGSVTEIARSGPDGVLRESNHDVVTRLDISDFVGHSDEMGHSAGASFYHGTGENAGGGGQYGGNSSGRLTSPVIDPGALVDASLQFNYVLSLEEYYDKANVHVLVDGQSILLAESDAFYGDEFDPFGESTDVSDLLRSRQFVPIAIDLSPYAGERIQLQFDFQSDPRVEGEGWYLDDILIEGTPVGPESRIRLDAESYESGQEVGVLLADWDVRGMGEAAVTASSAAGDVELVTLEETAPGVFRGTIAVGSGETVANGVLEIGPRDHVLVEYLDRTEGTGTSAIRTAFAAAVTLVELFHADFTDDSGRTHADGFSADGTQDQWHLSTGRGNQQGHSPTASFYFGSGEDDQGDGRYDNNAQGALISPVVDLASSVDTIWLEFNHLLDLRDEEDRARLLISTGEELVEIASSDWWSFVDVLPGSEEFVPLKFDLSRFAGQSIQVQFELTTSDAGCAEGWYIDDVAIRAIPSVPILDLNGDDEDGIHHSATFIEDQGPVPIVDVRSAGPLTISGSAKGAYSS